MGIASPKLSLQMVADLADMSVIDVQKHVRAGNIPSLDAVTVREWLCSRWSERIRQETKTELAEAGRLVRRRATPNWKE